MSDPKFPTEALIAWAEAEAVFGRHIHEAYLRDALSAHAATEKELEEAKKGRDEEKARADSEFQIATSYHRHWTRTQDERDKALVALADAKRALDEAEAKHAGCDAQVRELVSKALRAVRGQEEAESALASEREASAKHDAMRAAAEKDLGCERSRVFALAARVGELEGALNYFVAVCDTAPPVEFIARVGEACAVARRSLSRPAAGATTEHDGEEGER